MTQLEKTLLSKGWDMEEIDDAVADAVFSIEEGEDYDDVLSDIFGVEPDYVMDLNSLIEKSKELYCYSVNS